MEKCLIIYHKEDNDGLFSMAIIYNYLINELSIKPKDIDLFGTEYNELNKIGINKISTGYSKVIMTDISFNDYNKMIKLSNKLGNKFVWVDHHSPIINESVKYKFDNVQGWRDTSRSAVLNMYKYLYDQLDEKYINKTLPELFRILSAWDSFSYIREGYELDYVRNINVGVNTIYKLNHKEIIKLVKNIIYNPEGKYNSVKFIKKLYDTGKLINEAKDIENENLIKTVGDKTWKVNNRQACALFIQGPSSSLIFKSISEEIPNGIVFKRNIDSSWTISLYNTSTDYDTEFHCGNYLKEIYNGGGHPGAAGCQISEAKFIKILKSKQI